MDENEIKEALRGYKHFRGCYAFDELPAKITTPIGFVCNTSKRSDGGSHWVAIYIDEYRNGELFDSLASPLTLNQFKPFMSKHCNMFWFSGFPIQSSASLLCGVWCISFLAMRFKGTSLWEFTSVFRGIGNPVLNDIFLARSLMTINSGKKAE